MTLLQPTLLILIAAIGGWLMASGLLNLFFLSFTEKNIVGYRSCGILPALQPALAKKVESAIKKGFLLEEKGESGLHDKVIMQNLKPAIEAHVDQFLDERLNEAFPLLVKYMGEKTMLKLKEAFLSEIEIIFPLLVKQYGEKMFAQIEPGKLAEKMLGEIDATELIKNLKLNAAKQLFFIKIAGAVAGAGIGLLQILALSFIQ